MIRRFLSHIESTICPDIPLGYLLLVTLIALFVQCVCSSTKHSKMSRVNHLEFLPGHTNITVREGEVAVLPCSVRHLGTKKVSWRRVNGDDFLSIGKFAWADEDHISIEYSRSARSKISHWNLVIKYAKPSDAGMYECQVTTRKGRSKHVQLNVYGPPISKPDSSVSATRRRHPDTIPNLPATVCALADQTGCLISITGRRFVDLGDKIELICNATQGVHVADEMDWFKEGDKIDSSKYGHVRIEKSGSLKHRYFASILTIEHSASKDSGKYICRSSRNNIASMEVTVLHAETENKRRDSETQRTQKSYPSQNSRSTSGSTATSGSSTQSGIRLLCILSVMSATSLTAIRHLAVLSYTFVS